MGNGALVSTSLFPAICSIFKGSNVADELGARSRQVYREPGGGVSIAAANQRQVNANPTSQGQAGGVVSVLRPIEIVNFRSMDAAPAILAQALR